MRSSVADRLSLRARALFEGLESRQMMAAHIVGNPATYATIQAAVNAALAGQVINVDAGTYAELVTVNKTLTIRGAQANVDARAASRGNAATESLITGGSDIGYDSGASKTCFYLTADDVTIDGFTVKGNFNTGFNDGAGIVMAPTTSGAHIQNNIVTTNVAGIYLSNYSASDAAVIQRNLISYNNNSGQNSGRGVYSDGGVSGGNLTNVLITNNTFVGNTGFGLSPGDNPQAAVSLEAQFAPQSNITISNNIMTGNGKGVLAFNASNLTITGNTITMSQDNQSAALRFEGLVSNVLIKNNTVSNNLGAAIRIDMKAKDTPNSGFVINGNNLFSNAAGGLVVDANTYTGTLDAKSNWWGSSFGPSSDGPGFGDSMRANGNLVNFSLWLTTPSSTAPEAYTPRSTGASVIADLTALRGTMSDLSLRGKVDQAITKLNAANNASMWLDDTHIKVATGDSVFINSASAVTLLNSVAKANSAQAPAAGVNGVIDRLVDQSRDLAAVAISELPKSQILRQLVSNVSLLAGNIAGALGADELAIGLFGLAWKATK